MGPFPGEGEFEGIPVGEMPRIPAQSDEALRLKMRKRGLEDFYFFTKAILGYRKLTKHTHGALCRFLQTCPLNRRLVQMPRGHYKTTISTISLNIWRAIKDPNIRILIVAGTGGNAERFILEIRKHFESNELFRWLYPESIPDDFHKARWNNSELELKRTAYWREPTFDAIGAGGMVESRHYDVITGDDMIGEKEFNSDAEMMKRIEWVSGIESLLINSKMYIDFVGTYWRKGDVYDYIRQFYGGDKESKPIGPHAMLKGDIAIFHRGMIENGELIFPEEFDMKFVLRLMKNNPERYAAQYANDPVSSGMTVFQKEWLRYFTLEKDEGGNPWICIWDKQTGTMIKRLDPREMRIMVLYDPAKSETKKACRNAMHVVAKGGGPDIFVLDSFVGMYKPNEAVDLIFNIDKEWRPEFFSIEGVGYQGALKYWIAERAETEGLPYPPILEYHPGSQQSKDQRIRGLQPMARNGHIWLQESQLELIEEFTFYPNFRYVDAIDALAQGLEYWENSFDEAAETESRIREEARLSAIDATGYGIRPELSELLDPTLPMEELLWLAKAHGLHDLVALMN